MERMNLAYARRISSRTVAIKEEPEEDDDDEFEDGMAAGVRPGEGAGRKPAAKKAKTNSKIEQDEIEKKIWSEVVPIVRQELKAIAGKEQDEEEDQRDVGKIAKATEKAIAKIQRHFKAVLKEEAEKEKKEERETAQPMNTDHKEEQKSEDSEEKDAARDETPKDTKKDAGEKGEDKKEAAEKQESNGEGAAADAAPPRRAAKRNAASSSSAALRSRSVAARTEAKRQPREVANKEASKAQTLVTPKTVAKNVQRFDLTPPQWAAELAEARMRSTRSASTGRRRRSTTPRRGHLARQLPKPTGFPKGEVFDVDAAEEGVTPQAS